MLCVCVDTKKMNMIHGEDPETTASPPCKRSKWATPRIEALCEGGKLVKMWIFERCQSRINEKGVNVLKTIIFVVKERDHFIFGYFILLLLFGVAGELPFGCLNDYVMLLWRCCVGTHKEDERFPFGWDKKTTTPPSPSAWNVQPLEFGHFGGR